MEPELTANAPLPDKSFRLSPEQMEIARLLHDRLGPIVMGTYTDICRLTASGQGLTSQRHLAGFLIRELESTLRKYLYSIVDVDTTAEDKSLKTAKEKIDGIAEVLKNHKPEKNALPSHKTKMNKIMEVVKKEELDTHKEQIEKILTALKIEKLDPAAAFWLEKHKYFSDDAHLPRAKRPKELDAGFINNWETFQALIRTLINHSERQYIAFLNVVDKIKEAPSKDNLERFKKLPNNYLIQKQFFDGNENPDWLTFLDKEGYFDYPPPAVEKLDDVELVNAFHWPVAEYLARMAASPKPAVQAKVLEIVKKIPKTDNTWTNQEMIKISIALPIEQSIQLYEKVNEAIETFTDGFFIRDIVKTVKYWLENGQSGKALELCKNLFSIQAATGEYERIDTRYRDDYTYKEMIKVVRPSLVSARGVEAVKFFANLLDQALSLEYADKEQDKLLYVSREDLEEDDPPSRGVLNVLITAFRDSCIQAVNEKK